MPIIPFAVGVLSSLFKAFLVGAYPNILPVYCLVQFPLLVIVVVHSWAKEKQLLYLTELCWVTNMLGWAYIATEAAHAAHLIEVPFSPEYRLWCARAFFVVANGPLACTVLLNHNLLVFHDAVETSGFFIHFSPALVSWVIKWKPAARSIAGTTLYALDHIDPASAMGVGELWWMGMQVYFSWWCVYGVWLLSVGYAMPGAGGWGESSFNDMRGGIEKTFKVSQPRLQAVVYLVAHAAGVCLITLLPSAVFFHYFVAHTLWLILLMAAAVYFGAGYYHHAFGKKIGQHIEKAVQKALLEQKTSQKD